MCSARTKQYFVGYNIMFRSHSNNNFMFSNFYFILIG